jgi:hypothetical protein
MTSSWGVPTSSCPKIGDTRWLWQIGKQFGTHTHPLFLPDTCVTGDKLKRQTNPLGRSRSGFTGKETTPHKSSGTGRKNLTSQRFQTLQKHPNLNHPSVETWTPPLGSVSPCRDHQPTWLRAPPNRRLLMSNSQRWGRLSQPRVVGASDNQNTSSVSLTYRVNFPGQEYTRVSSSTPFWSVWRRRTIPTHHILWFVSSGQLSPTVHVSKHFPWHPRYCGNFLRWSRTRTWCC